MNYNVDMCCFSVKPCSIKCNSQDLMARTQDNVSERSGMSTHRPMFLYKEDIIIISCKYN